MGEDAGKFFMGQMLDVLAYMQSKGVAHRDLKLENILVDDQLNIKLTDFGFASFKHINKLKTYTGTPTYMAPEIKEGKIYDGRKTDIFSAGVILFIITLGTFPFKEAKKEDKYYSLLVEGKHDEYWSIMEKDFKLSDDFKDIITKCLSYDPAERPNLEDLISH